MTATATMMSADRSALDALIAHVRNATTDTADATLEVPVSHYTSPERAARERALLLRLPLAVAHISEVAEPGMFVTRTYMGVPVLIVGQRGGGAKVFRNLCRHRGGMVELAESGKRSIFMCQYHGWSYAAADGGALKVVPYEETAGGVDKTCRSLIELPSEVRHGLVWARLEEGEMMPVADYLGEAVDNQIAPWDLAGSILFMDHVMEKQINWKIVVDGTLDSLHAQFLHGKPGGVGALSVNHAMVFRDYGRHGKMIMGRRRLKRKIDAGEMPEPDLRTMASVMLLYPNSLFVEAPDHVELWSVWPDAQDPQRSTVRIRFLVRANVLTPEIADRVNRSWEILRLAATEEDFPMEESIQCNAQASPRASFTYGRNEKSAQHLHRQLFQDIDGGVAGPGTLVKC
jgi:phenylpropionate dioxygenase-like ring-hydroxylating dioxygenase large terminal subunit